MPLSRSDWRYDIGVTELTYDRENESFTLHGWEDEVIDLETLRDDHNIFTRILALTDNTLSLGDANVGIVVDGLCPIGTDKLQHLLSKPSEEVDQTLEETRLVMSEAYSRLANPDAVVDSSNTGYMGFHFGLLRPQHPTLFTLGNCACVGVDPMGIQFDETDWDTGYTSWAVHNVETGIQWISLYAGLGHLSLEASKLDDAV